MKLPKLVKTSWKPCKYLCGKARVILRSKKQIMFFSKSKVNFYVWESCNLQLTVSALSIKKDKIFRKVFLVIFITRNFLSK